MKTTKKGFTLIELIVVIAIIGVLAAILVPAMLGYVKKSKIQSANASAKTLMNAANSALTEMDEVDEKVPENGDLTCDGKGNDDSLGTSAEAKKLLEFMEPYSDKAKTATYAICIKDGVAVACAAKSGSYFGTMPAFLTNKNYDKSEGLGTSPSLDEALKKAKEKAGITSTSSTPSET